jgi:hypothetical protein
LSLTEIALGMTLGLGLGISSLYIAGYRRAQRASITPSPVARSITEIQLQRAKQEYRAIMLEREALAAAVTRFYEAEAAGEITAEERASLVRKYEEELKTIDAKLSNLELLIEVGEMERLREEVVKLFQEKFKQIEERMAQAKMKLGVTGPVRISETPTVEVLKPKVEEKGPVKRRVESKAEERSRQLREEMLAALARLEQMDVEEG